jgi:E3 ubiquitin-protein ligase TRIP12
MEEPLQSEGDDAPDGEVIVEDSDQSDEEAEEDPPDAPGSGNSLNDLLPNPMPPAAETSFGGSILSSDFNYGSYMSSIGSRLKSILNNIKPKSDPTTRLLSLQELSELLSMSNEDSLSGYFSADAYVKELVHIMGGPRKNDDDDGNDGEGDSDMPQDEDAALAAALAISGGGFMGEENLEEQLLACRCLANLIEAMPGSAYTLVHNGAVPVLCSKLLAIQFIDLAEQTISVRLFTHVILSVRTLTLLFVDSRETFGRIPESHRA